MTFDVVKFIKISIHGASMIKLQSKSKGSQAPKDIWYYNPVKNAILTTNAALPNLTIPVFWTFSLTYETADNPEEVVVENKSLISLELSSCPWCPWHTTFHWLLAAAEPIAKVPRNNFALKGTLRNLCMVVCYLALHKVPILPSQEIVRSFTKVVTHDNFSNTQKLIAICGWGIICELWTKVRLEKGIHYKCKSPVWFLHSTAHIIETTMLKVDNLQRSCHISAKSSSHSIFLSTYVI